MPTIDRSLSDCSCKAADTSGDGFIERNEFSRLLSYLVYFNNLWHVFEEIDR